jgi:hypothetical protein
MFELNSERVFVVHFSAATSSHNFQFPNDLRNVIKNPSCFCLSCVAFTEISLINGLKPPGYIGLVFDVTDDPDPSGTCCDRSGGKQIRWAEDTDAGKMLCVPCMPEKYQFDVSHDQLIQTLSVKGSHNEWIIKPPHSVTGLFLYGPQVLSWQETSAGVWDSVPSNIPEDEDFQSLPLWGFNDEKVERLR